MVSWQSEPGRPEFTIGELCCTLKTGEKEVRALLHRPIGGHNPYELVSRSEVLILADTGGEVGKRLDKLLKSDT